MNYVYALVSLLLIDGAWLAVMVPWVYRPKLSHLMAEKPVLWAAGVFYVLFTVGLTYLIIEPALKAGLSTGALFFRAALFGLVAYATYDLTNLATMKQWPIGITVVDMVWGAVLSGVVAVIVLYAQGLWR